MHEMSNLFSEEKKEKNIMISICRLLNLPRVVKVNTAMQNACFLASAPDKPDFSRRQAITPTNHLQNV